MATFVSPHLLKKRIVQSFSQYVQQTAFATAPKMAQVKPPNVLVYRPKSVTFSAKFDPVLATERCLPRDKYVVYELPSERAPTDPWMENCRLLLVPNVCHSKGSTGSISKTESAMFEKYISAGGKVINFNDDVMDQMAVSRKSISKPGSRDAIDQDGRVILEKCDALGTVLDSTNADCVVISSTNAQGQKETMAAIFKHESSQGFALHCTLPVLSQEGEKASKLPEEDASKVLKCLLENAGVLDGCNEGAGELPDLTPCYLLCEDKQRLDTFLGHLGVGNDGVKELKGQVTLKFMPPGKNTPPVSETNVPVLYPKIGEDSKPMPPRKFNFLTYSEHLLSKDFGKILIYGDVVSSTMNILEPLVTKVPYNTSVTCVARQQLSGKGRGGNKWISPPGTAMFSLTTAIPMSSRLGQHLPLLQHMVTVAVVRGIRSMPGLDSIDLRVKWPNDIYYGTDVKIGGVIVKSTIFRDQCIATIGCGINVENERPTTCVNAIIRSVLPDHRPLSCEEVLARSLTSLEQLISKYQKEGPVQFFAFYYKYWIHGEADVKVQILPDGSEGNATDKEATIVDAAIVGLDPDGFLRVSVKEGQKMAGQIISLQPDSNSFDIIKNLIAMKISS